MAQALSAPRPCDLLVHNCAELATPLGTSARGGAALGRIHVQPHAAVAIVGDRIAEVGAERDLESRWSPRARLDARGGLLVPGFVDAHSHPVFVGTREEEFELRTRGATYVEIAQQGGGILSSVRGVRAASAVGCLCMLGVIGCTGPHTDFVEVSIVVSVLVALTTEQRGAIRPLYTLAAVVLWVLGIIATTDRESGVYGWDNTATGASRWLSHVAVVEAVCEHRTEQAAQS